MSYSFSLIHKNIILVEADTQYLLCSMFLRPQEFYESPYKNIRGRHFTLEEYMDTYAKDKGSFSYYTDWCGFNIPSESFEKFIEIFQYDMSAKEHLLVSSVQKLIENPQNKYYIIGVLKGYLNKKETLNHETAHALWYLNEDYNSKMTKLINKLPHSLYKQASKNLMLIGYDTHHINDEIQAYLVSTKSQKLSEIFGWKVNDCVKFSKKYQNIFLKTTTHK